jgi:5-methylcytosine-specific restriction endonuclease McrA
MPAKGSTTEAGLGYQWRILVRRAKRIYQPICHICQQQIDETLPATHPMSWTLDHLDPRATHGPGTPEIDRVRPAHRRCNGQRGARPITHRHKQNWAL